MEEVTANVRYIWLILSFIILFQVILQWIISDCLQVFWDFINDTFPSLPPVTKQITKTNQNGWSGAVTVQIIPLNMLHFIS